MNTSLRGHLRHWQKCRECGAQVKGMNRDAHLAKHGIAPPSAPDEFHAPRIKHTGIAVRLADLIPFARKGCAYCSGTGQRMHTKPDKTKGLVPCQCSLPGFLKAQKCAQDPATGRIYFCEPIAAWSEESRRIDAEEKAKAAVAPAPVPAEVA